MGRLVEPRPEEVGTPPGKAVIWATDRNGNTLWKEPCELDRAVKRMQSLIDRRPEGVRWVGLNYKREDGSAIEAIRVEFTVWPLQKPLRESLPWWLGGKKVKS